MRRTKVLLLCTVLATLATGVLEGVVPYFPIEISRTATGPYGKAIFRGGVLLCIVSAWDEGASEREMLPAVGVVIAAVADDATSLFVHLVGVLFMGLGIAANVQTTAHAKALTLAIVIYGLSALARLWCVAPDVGYDLSLAVNKFVAVMYDGQDVSEVQLAVFKAGGVAQWTAFAICSTIFSNGHPPAISTWKRLTSMYD